jgi:hypothetical protein
MKNLFLMLLGCIVFFSCEPPRDCTDPKCADSPILVKLKANLSDTNMVLHVGDTLKMRLMIPDVLATNQGTFDVASVQQAWFGLQYYRIDTIISKTDIRFANETFIFKKGQFASANSLALEFDKTSKELELHFVLNKKGKFYIQVSPQSGRLEMTEKNGSKFLIMFNTDFNVKDSHTDLYLSWIGNVADRNEMRTNITSQINSGFGWYSFKVE